MQAKIPKLFLATLSLFGVLSFPSGASALEGKDYTNNLKSEQREFYNSSYRDREQREHLQLQRAPRRDYQDDHNRHFYNDDYTGNRWYNERWRYGNKSYQGEHCQFPRKAYGNGKQYRPRYYGNDYYGYVR
jgi:hypothetical protein